MLKEKINYEDMEKKNVKIIDLRLINSPWVDLIDNQESAIVISDDVTIINDTIEIMNQYRSALERGFMRRILSTFTTPGVGDLDPSVLSVCMFLKPIFREKQTGDNHIDEYLGMGFEITANTVVLYQDLLRSSLNCLFEDIIVMLTPICTVLNRSNEKRIKSVYREWAQKHPYWFGINSDSEKKLGKQSGVE